MFSVNRGRTLRVSVVLYERYPLPKHELRGMIHDVVSDYTATAAAKPDKQNTRAVAIACTDDFSGLYLVDLHLLFCHRALYLDRNQLQQLPPGVFSDLTSVRFSRVWLYEMRMSVCLVIHAQIKDISRFTYPQTYVSTSARTTQHVF